MQAETQRLQDAEAELELATVRYKIAGQELKTATTALQQAQREKAAALKEAQAKPVEPEQPYSYVHRSVHKRMVVDGNA